MQSSIATTSSETSTTAQIVQVCQSMVDTNKLIAKRVANVGGVDEEPNAGETKKEKLKRKIKECLVERKDLIAAGVNEQEQDVLNVDARRKRLKAAVKVIDDAEDAELLGEV